MTLTQAASLTRKLILLLIIFLILGTTGLVGYKIWLSVNNKTGSAEMIPDTKFGILPPLNLPSSITSSATVSYQLNMGSSGLPTFNKVAKVYFIPQPTAILTNEKIADLAQKLNFNTESQIQNNQYIFTEDSKKLTIDSNLGSLLYQKEASTSAKSPVVDSDTKLSEDAKDFLNNLGLLNEDFKKGRTKITYLNFNGNNVETTAVSNANGAEISLWRQDIDNLPIITEGFKQSLFFVRVTKSARDLDNYLTINYLYYPIDKTTFSIYPLKTANEAYAALQGGQGVILLPNNKSSVTLTSAYLAYFQSSIYSPYLQPVYIFEGENFVAMIPAVINQYLSQPK
ncbi:MAG: hypothetical protein HYW45_01085 [Candidatus Daviesbacteria bacterium]|nr:MAG: hypothetical protein HYW45_01085 [Candidatus Daviesbacteria bacterium]